MNTPVMLPEPITLDTLRAYKSAGRKFAMLTAYDYPTAAAAQAAGVPVLLVGDSMGTVLLGQSSTRDVPLELMLILAEAVRRGAPHTYLIGDMPFIAMQGGAASAVDAARAFQQRCNCAAVKFEAGPEDDVIVSALKSQTSLQVVVHLGLRPQQVTAPDGYRAQARDDASIRQLVDTSRHMVTAGADILLLEAVPGEASQAVVDAVGVPVIGCGAGPACDGHVVVTQDMLGIGNPKPPRFVPRLADLGAEMEAAMQRYVTAIESGDYPGPEHTYGMKKA